MTSLMARTADRVRAEIAGWPDGAAEAEGFLNHDGVDISRRVRVHVHATKSGRTLRLDFSATDPQAYSPVNLPQATAQAVSMQAVIAAPDPTIPMNSGAFDAIECHIPPGRLISPQFPASVNHYFPTAHLTYNVVLAAMGKLNPSRAVAPSGLGSGAIAVGYPMGRAGKPTVQYEILITSLGGTSEGDGASVVLAMNHFAPGTPVEIVETEYPVRVRKFAMWTDSAGAGTQRGGIGFDREYEFLGPCTLTVRSSNQAETARGIFGGGSPQASETSITLPDGTSQEMGVLETRAIEPGLVLRLARSGGGGYGDPHERPAGRVLADVADGYVSREAAARLYGVAVGADGRLDEDATRRLRSR